MAEAEEQKKEVEYTVLQKALISVITIMLSAVICIATGFVLGLTWNLICVGWRWAERLFPI